MKKLAILSSLLLLALNSCSNEEIFNEEIHPNYEKRITVVAEDLTPAEGTRTSYTENGNGYSFAWSEGDALGIFPENGYQTAFPIGTDGVGSNTAVFDGGKWALRPNESYAAYYPLIEDFKLNSTAIPVNYTGQVQDGNGSTDHIGKYDFMASTFTDVDAKGNVNFQLQHLGCLVEFKFTMLQADTYSALEITSDDECFITSAKYSLADNGHEFTDVRKSDQITIGLNNVSTTTDNKNITITAMFAPVDLSGKTLTLSLKGRSEVYTFEVEGQNLPKGNAVNNTSEIVDDTPYVTFLADAEQTLKLRYYGGMSEITTIEYSVNNGEWKHLGASTDAISFGGNYGNIRLRGVSSIGTSTSAVLYSTIVFGIEGVNVSSYGDIRTLVDYENYATANTENARFINLFRNCKVLTSTPNLYATSLASSCYFSMFADCTSLTSAPELSATTLASSCYYGMFRGCTSLTKAPELPALSLVNECYSTMFSGCTSLNYVKMMATDISAMKCLGNWLYKGSTTGTFIKNSSATWDVTGASGIPEGWTVKYVDENGNEVYNINNGHEFVDLGLSVKWATCNVGAEKPEDYGNYYAWGETDGTESGKTIFTWDSYFDTSSGPGYNNRGEYIISFKKYQLNSKDLSTVIEPSDDAATVNWGTEWRIPTFSEMQELVNDCSWEWVTINGVNGYKVTSKGNGNFIFLPAAGWYGDSGLADDNASCSYWMSTMSPYYNYTGCMLSCNSSNGGNDNTCQGSIWRCRGLSVRAVCP